MRTPAWLATILACLLAIPAASAGSADRTAVEAALLLRIVIADEPAPERCQYDLDWSRIAVPEYIAEEYLGTTLHADLLGASESADYRSTIDPAKRNASAFCSDDEHEAYRKARFDVFEGDATLHDVVVARTAYSFPVFDADYRKAVVVISRSSLSEDRNGIKYPGMALGQVVKLPGESVEAADLYSRETGGWKRIKREIIGQS